MDNNIVTRKMSTSMRNAITANNYRGHALGKTVKQLEVEKDMKMLSLQIKKDEVKLSSPKPRRKTGNVTIEDENVNSIETVKIERKSTLTKTQKPQILPLIRSNSASIKREGFYKHRSSTVASSGSSPPSPRATRSGTYQTYNSSLDDVNIKEDRSLSVVSTRLSRHNTLSPILTAKRPKPEHYSPPGGVLVHRGLAIKPLSTTTTRKQATKEKQSDKAKAVFSRLYQVQSAKPKKSIAELMEGPPVQSSRLDGRRRSLSLPDLSDAMEDLRNCRYLRKSSKEDNV